MHVFLFVFECFEAVGLCGPIREGIALLYPDAPSLVPGEFFCGRGRVHAGHGEILAAGLALKHDDVIFLGDVCDLELDGRVGVVVLVARVGAAVLVFL